MSDAQTLQITMHSEDAGPSDRASHAIIAAIETLIDGLPPAEKQRVLRAVSERIRPIPVPKAGDVLGIVVQLLPRDRQWTVAELKHLVEEQRMPVTPKALHNALGYLTRRGHIHRLGYGRYMVGGVPVVTADELGGQPAITEGDADD